MPFQIDKTQNCIFVFRNTSRVKEHSPDYNCFIAIDGVEYRAKLWNQVDKFGKIFCSGKVKRPEEFYTREDMRAEAKAAYKKRIAEGDIEPKSTRSRRRKITEQGDD